MNLTTFPVTFFSKLDPPLSFEPAATTDFLFARTAIRLTSLFIAVIVLVVSLYQFNFKGRAMMSKRRATLLYMSYVHLPLLLTPTLGILFGCGIMVNLRNASLDEIDAAVLFLTGLAFTTLTGSSSLFLEGTRLNLLIPSKTFGYWMFPFDMLDYVAMFIAGVFLPFRNSSYNKYVTIASSVQILSGVRYLWKRQKQVFVTIGPQIMDSKVIVDHILLGILTIIYIYTDTNHVTKSIFILLAHVLDMVIAAVLHLHNLLVSDEFQSMKTKSSKRTSPMKVLSFFRSAISMAITDAAEKEDLKWLIQCSFSPEMICEIVRLCVIKGYDLNEIQMRETSFGTVELLQLKFLAFQLRYASLRQSQSESFYDEIKTEIARVKDQIASFWTEGDYDHMSLVRLGEMMKATHSLIRRACLATPRSVRMQELYQEFSSEVLGSLGALPAVSDSQYFALENPEGTIYEKFAPGARATNMSRQRKTTQEILHKRMATRGGLPVMGFMLFSFIAVYSMAAGLWPKYYIVTREYWNVFMERTKYMQMGISLGNLQVTRTDRKLSMPDSEKVMKALNVNEETAGQFRSPLAYEAPFLGDMSDVVKDLAWLGRLERRIDPENCRDVSLPALLAFDSVMENPQLRCYLSNSNMYLVLVGNFVSNMTIAEIQEAQTKYHIALGVCLIFSFFVFLACFLVEKSSFTNKLREVRLDLFRKPEYREYGSHNLFFSFGFNFLFWLISGACFVGLFYSFLLPSNGVAERINKLLVDTARITKIAMNLQNVLALVEMTMVDVQNWKTYRSLELERCEIVNDDVEHINEEGLLKQFEELVPLNLWHAPNRSSFSEKVLDVCHLLTHMANLSTSELDFLIARYFFMTNVTQLVTSTLPSMFELTHTIVQKDVTYYWWMSVLFLLISFGNIIVYRVFVFRRKYAWFKAANALQRLYHPERDESYLDRFMYPIIVAESGVIVYVNRECTSYTDLTISQLIGQRVDDIWTIEDGICFFEERKLRVISEDFGENFEMLIFIDRTEYEQLKTKQENLLRRKTSPLQRLPLRSELTILEMRVNSQKVDPEVVFETYKRAEEACPAVARIRCGCSFYLAVLFDDVSLDDLLAYLSVLMSLPKDSWKIAMTHGVVTILSGNSNNTLPMLVGRAADRAHRCTVDGCYGCVYVDFSIVDGSDADLADPRFDPFIFMSPAFR